MGDVEKTGQPNRRASQRVMPHGVQNAFQSRTRCRLWGTRFHRLLRRPSFEVVRHITGAERSVDRARVSKNPRPPTTLCKVLRALAIAFEELECRCCQIRHCNLPRRVLLVIYRQEPLSVRKAAHS